MTEYDENFLGIPLPLPTFTPARVADILAPSSQLPGGLAIYPNYAVATDKRHRAPAYAVLHLDQSRLRTTKRSNKWKIDSRVGADWQLDNSYYADNPWDKGHMADRESAGWGDTPAAAQDSADETFYYANAALQHKNLNEDEWLGLEAWVLKLDIVRGGRLTVFSGPIFGDTPRIVTPPARPAAIVPVGFFKIACFVNSGTGRLDVRAFIIYQDTDALKDLQGRKTFNYTKYQVTVTEIERLTELRFPDEVRGQNPLYYHPNAAAGRRLNIRSFPERIDINQPEDLVHHETVRTHVADDEVEVYIASALISPPGGAEAEWVSLANYESHTVSLAGWRLRDRAGHKLKLKGAIPPGGTRVLRGTHLRPITLPDDGGVLTLLNNKGERIDRADYTRRELAALRAQSGRKNSPLNFHTYRLGLRPR
ncbi:MAG: DNA/RNA non-specific endonuclease [Opitutae bacterium]|nr:DNA/RNA non-specific endonuclease [Opitutae bacterium]